MRQKALLALLLVGACAKPREERAHPPNVSASPSKSAALNAPERPQPPGAVVVRTDVGTFEAPSVRLMVTFTEGEAPPALEVALSAQAEGGRQWAVLASVEPAFPKTKHATARLTRMPLQVGLASAELRGPSGPPTLASDGTLELNVTGREVHGTVRTKDADLSATFEGPLSVECMVPAAWLQGPDTHASPGAPVPVAPSSARGSTVVPDEAGTTARCRALKEQFR
ncbi:hypothetical protein D7V97_20705 [Corallococcus sp. CA053C]|uniref:hypothetical protein n=1 Tax=Corallococcus sp. CA053C TaxID=2316732 RepID=UPI000EA20CE3|nr:hypothetical protein [Corallococcus sp. CA053C]RKH08029.1 hypothetical protein D7V97_20705 [Corallococcus sp. CA053C]